MITTSASPRSMLGRNAARSAGDPWYSSGFRVDSATYSLISCAQCPTSVGGHTTSAGEKRQARTPALDHGRRQDARRLQRLAEAHVVAQRAVQLEPAKKREPVDALLLVRPQHAAALERQHEILNLAVVQERLQKRAIALAALPLRGGQRRRRRAPARQRKQRHERGEGFGRHLARAVHRVAHAAHQGDQQQHAEGRQGGPELLDQLGRHGGGAAARAGRVVRLAGVLERGNDQSQQTRDDRVGSAARQRRQRRARRALRRRVGVLRGRLRECGLQEREGLELHGLGKF